MSDPKLPRQRRSNPPSNANHNEWLAADQLERRKSLGVILLVVAALIAGIWFSLSGLNG